MNLRPTFVWFWTACRARGTTGAPKMGSLIPETLEEMSNDEEFKRTAEQLRQRGQAALTREEKMKRQRSLDNLGVPSFFKVAQVRSAVRTAHFFWPQSWAPFADLPSAQPLCEFPFFPMNIGRGVSERLACLERGYSVFVDAVRTSVITCISSTSSLGHFSLSDMGNETRTRSYCPCL